MANMSYCRFQNTLNDLNDCYNVIRSADVDEVPLKAILSEDERYYAERMYKLCKRFVEEYEYLEELFADENEA